MNQDPWATATGNPRAAASLAVAACGCCGPGAVRRLWRRTTTSPTARSIPMTGEKVLIDKSLSARKRAKVKENNEVYGSLCNLERIIFDMEYLDWIPFCKNTFTLIIADKKSAMAALAAIADYARMLFPVIKGRKKYVYADYITIRPPTSTYKKSKCTPMSYAMAHNPFYIVSRAGSSGTQPVAMLNPKKLKKAISKKLAIREMRILKSVYDKILYFELSSLQKDCFDGDPFFIWRKYEHKYEKHYYGYGEN
jgi:hypothetical protein